MQVWLDLCSSVENSAEGPSLFIPKEGTFECLLGHQKNSSSEAIPWNDVQEGSIRNFELAYYLPNVYVGAVIKSWTAVYVAFPVIKLWTSLSSFARL